MQQTRYWLPLALFLALLSRLNLQADALDNWTTNQISTNYWGIDCVVYGNGHFVAGAENQDDEAFFSSEDGKNWMMRYSGGGPWGTSLQFVNGRFVGVGGYNSVSSSADSTNWTISTLPAYVGSDYDAGFGDVTYGNGLYVKVGITNGIGSILTSSDGNTWTYRRKTPANGGYISSIAYGTVPFYPSTQPWFVAVGNNDGHFYYSSTGASWSGGSIPGGNVVGFGNGLFIIPLTGSSNLVSSDGLNWSQLKTGLTNKIGRPIYQNGIFWAWATNYLATSVDGTNWVQSPKQIPCSEQGGLNVSYYQPFATDGKRVVTFGNTQGNDVYSDNGFIYLSDPLVSVRLTNSPTRKVVLTGLAGRNYQIQSASNLGASANWQTNATLQLTNTPYLWSDSSTNAARFYRAVLMP